MLKKLFLYFLGAVSIIALPQKTVAQVPQIVTCHVTPVAVHNIDLGKSSALVTFYATCKSVQDYDCQRLEITNAERTRVDFMEKKIVQGSSQERSYISTSCRYTARLRSSWNMRSFPFDKQSIAIHLEDNNHDIRSLKLQVDTQTPHLDPRFHVEGWKIEKFTAQEKDHVYPHAFGEKDTQTPHTYSEIVAQLLIKREGIRLYFSFFIGFLFAFFLCLIVFLFPVWELIQRENIILGAIFAHVGNKYVIDPWLSTTSAFTLTDAIQISSLLMIVLATCIVLATDILVSKQQHLLARRLNLAAAFLSTIAYVAYVGHWTFSSWNS